MKNYAYLIQVNATANNNKFYEIFESDNGTVSVKYGRVGGTVMQKDYGHEKSFHSLKREKENKGYQDRTALHAETQKDSSLTEALSYKPIENEKVGELFDILINSSREFMKKNYTVTAVQITEKMIKEAEADIDNLNRIALKNQPNALYEFNKQLQVLFTDIPRNMSKVELYLAKTEGDFEKIIARETEMLDNVKGIAVPSKTDNTENKDQTVLEANGLTVRPVTYKEEDQILSHLGRDYDGRSVENRYVQGFVVENKATRERYEAYKEKHNMKPKDVRLFYHGSKVENWNSIIKQGLSLNPNATTTGKMFGQGLYFAPECRKSLNYMDVKGSHWNSGKRDTGYCAVYAVALGKCYQPSYILGSSFRGSDLPQGTQSVFAGKNNPHLGLRNDEYIVYDQAACTIKYLLEMTSQNVREKQYDLDRDVLRDKLSDGFDKLVKTEDGVQAELALEQLSPAALSELSSKIYDNGLFDYQSLSIDYDERADRITLYGVCLDGTDELLLPDLTGDDYAFLAREMKKTFAVSEDAWKDLMKKASDYPVGKTVARRFELATSCRQLGCGIREVRFADKNGVVKNDKSKNDVVKE